eukprot:s2393_g7.t1
MSAGRLVLQAMAPMDPMGSVEAGTEGLLQKSVGKHCSGRPAPIMLQRLCQWLGIEEFAVLRRNKSPGGTTLGQSFPSQVPAPMEVAPMSEAGKRIFGLLLLSSFCLAEATAVSVVATFVLQVGAPMGSAAVSEAGKATLVMIVLDLLSLVFA